METKCIICRQNYDEDGEGLITAFTTYYSGENEFGTISFSEDINDALRFESLSLANDKLYLLRRTHEALSKELFVSTEKVEEHLCKSDKVNHPTHYTSGKYEVIDILQGMLSEEEFKGFCKGNVLKYVLRSDIKHETPVEDLQKAEWYLNRLIKTLEEK